MENVDKESIKYILCKAWKGNYWKCFINNITEYTIKEEKDITNLLFSLGMFNKQDFFEVLRTHCDFVFDNDEHKLIPLLMNRNFTKEEVSELIWGDIDKRVEESRNNIPTLENRYNSLFGQIHL